MNTGLREKLMTKDGCQVIAMRHQIEEVFWNRIHKNQFHELIQETQPVWGISQYLNLFGFGNES